MKSDYYVYAHYRVDTGVPFYVGKGRRNRAKDRWNRNQYWHRIVEKYGYTIKILANNLTNEAALKLEKRLILLYRNRIGKLSNLTDGGEGIAGFKFSTASKKKMSESRKGRVFHSGYAAIMRKATLGIKFTEEHKINLRKSILAYHAKRRAAGLLNPFGYAYDKE